MTIGSVLIYHSVTSQPFIDESENKSLWTVVVLARMMDDSSIVLVPMSINIFGYDIEAIMLEKRDFMDFKTKRR